MIRLMILKPTVVFAAQVAQAGFSYPIAETLYDSVTVGAFGDVQEGQTITFGSTPGGRDWGRQRIRKAATADTIYFGRSSGGGRPGEVALQDNAYITVYDDYRLWLKMQRIDPDGAIFKDADIAYVDQTIEPPPVAVFESAFAGTVNGGGIITVSFDAADSFAVATGASISSYLWDIRDGTITVGTATSAQMTATFPAGARNVGLTVTDSNGNSHTTHRLVYAYEEGDDHNVELFHITRHEITPQGQQMAIQLHEDLDTADYPDGTAVLVWDGEPLSAADRSNLLFQGWLDTEPVHVGAGRTGYLRDTTLELVDVGGMLRQLGGRPEYVENVEVPTKWTQMKGVTIDAFHHYLLHWHSTALEVTSYLDPAIGSDYAMISLGSDAGTLWEQVDGLCRKMTPDHYFTCDSFGVLRTVDDSMLQDIGDRIGVVQRALTEDDYTDIRFTFRPLPRYTITREGAIKPDASYVEALPEDYELTTYFCIAPGEAWGQGPAEWERNEGIARSQADLNSCAGHRYARLNAPYTEFEIDLSADMHPGIEPAHLTWVTLTFSAQYAAQRGFSFTAARGMPKRVTIRYENPDGTPVRSARLTWEIETVGLPAVTEIVQKGTDLPDNSFWGPGYEEGNFTTVIVPEQSYFHGDVGAYVLWDGARIFRTWDLLAAGGTVWEFVDSGVTGNVQDLRYVIKADNTVGAWLMTSDAIWWCADIMATTPVWDDVLTIATVRAADAAPTTGLVVFKCMAPYDTEPGYLIVATGPLAGDTSNIDYPHAYFWHTHDYGANWTQVDMTNYLVESFGDTRGYCYSSLYGMEIFRSEPGTIYCLRVLPRNATNSDVAVFVSDDLGDTWTRRSTDIPISNSGANQVGSLIHPFPSATDPSYVVAPVLGAGTYGPLLRSTDEWVTNSQVAANGTPAAYDGVSHLWRPNSRTSDPDHVIVWMDDDATGQFHLMESLDQGASWTQIYNSGQGAASVPNTGTGGAGSVSAAAYATPNGWPSNGDFWVLVKAVVVSGSTVGVIQTTDDNFGTLTSRVGNLNTLLGGNFFTSGPNGGVALPRLQENA